MKHRWILEAGGLFLAFFLALLMLNWLMSPAESAPVDDVEELILTNLMGPSVVDLAQFVTVIDSLGYWEELQLFAKQPVDRVVDMATGSTQGLPATIPVTEDSSWVADLVLQGDVVTICIRRAE